MLEFVQPITLRELDGVDYVSQAPDTDAPGEET